MLFGCLCKTYCIPLNGFGGIVYSTVHIFLFLSLAFSVLAISRISDDCREWFMYEI